MPPTVAALAIGVVGITIVAGCVLEWGAPSRAPPFVELILYQNGTSLTIPGMHVTKFSLYSGGGRLVGTIHWDHTSAYAGALPPYTILHCTTLHGYYGAPWNQSYNVSLSAGPYTFGRICFGLGNGTVTQTIEIVSP